MSNADDLDPVPGAETRVPEFRKADAGPFAQFHQPTPTSPIIRRIGAGPIRFVIGAALFCTLVVLAALLIG